MKELPGHFNLKAEQIKKLEGYGSVNYRVDTAGSGMYVLKHYKNIEEYELIEAETKLLSHISKKLPFQIPEDQRPLSKLKDGSFLRLLQFIEGDLLANADQNDALLYNFGEAIATLDKALLMEKSSPIAARKQVWDLQYCLLNIPKIATVKEASRRKLIHYFFDLFEQHVLPKQDSLRQSIIHGDLNENNVLVKDNKILGFIDFGDICRAPLIYEVAIAMTYVMLLNPAEPFSKACKVLQGYQSVLPLQKEEVSLLVYLIPARLCVSVCNSSEAIAKGEDTAYITINQEPAWKLLQEYISYNPIGITMQFFTALDMKIELEDTSAILKLRRRHFSEALSLSYDEPIHMTAAAFQYMYDNTGNSYLDAYNNIPLVGHCHPKISKVISEKVRKLNTNTRYLYQELTEYAQKLLSYFPEPLDQVFFVNSGSAATDLACRIARNYNKSNYFAVLEHGYHGNTQTAIDMSPYKFDGKGGNGNPEHSIKLPLPNMFEGKFEKTDDYINNAKEKLLHAISNGKTPAAFLAEPISGCGGQVPLAPEYLKKLKPFLEQHNILMISDEVQTGFGRIGSHFWGFEMHGIVPDMVILGKPIGNGHPIGAVVTTSKIADTFANGMEFFSSFGGNPVSCAVGSAVLDILEEEELQKNALSVGTYYKSELKKLQASFYCIGDVRGQGLFLGVEFLDKDQKPDRIRANKVKNKLKEAFILVSTDGPFDNVVKTKPPLCFTKENVDTLIDALHKIVQEIS